MSKSKADPKALVALREEGYNNVEIAGMLGIGEASVRRGLAKANYNPNRLPQEFIRKMTVKLQDPLRINVAKEGPGAVTADWHHPLTDYSLVNTFIDHAVEIGATNWLLVAGDWFNMDALSAFDYKQSTAGLPNELHGSTETMKRLLDVFPRIVLTWGNHDARVHKALGYKVRFNQAMRMMFAELDGDLDRIEISDLDHAIVDTPRGPYYVAHPKSYNANPLTSARKIAGIKHANIILGHSHHTAIGHDPSGKFVCAEIGGFFDVNKTEYLQRTTTFPTWQQGYGFIDSAGFLQIEGEGWSSRVGRSVK